MSKSTYLILASIIVLASILALVYRSDPDPAQEQAGETIIETSPKEDASDAKATNIQRLQAFESSNPVAEEALPPHVIRRWRGKFSPSFQELADLFESGELETPIAIPIFDGQSVEFAIEGIARYGPGRGALRGKSTRDPFGHALLTWSGEASSGTIRLPSRYEAYEIRYASRGEIFLSQLDLSLVKGCGLDARNREASHD